MVVEKSWGDALRRHFRRRLEEERDAARERRRHLKAWGLGEGDQETAQELSSIDQHTADHATGTFTRSQDMGLWEEARIAQLEAEAALERLERGTYGTCERCGRPVGLERLEALPTARLCIECARELEESRPVPDDPALRPGSRTGLREGWRSPAFGRRPHRTAPGLEEEGRQDVWEALGDYPSANSPQDEPERAREGREP